MAPNEIISILRSNVSRLIRVVDNREMEKVQEATEEAIQAVNKQRPINPVQDENATDKNGNPVIRCPVCGYALWNMERFCPYCGQKFVKEESPLTFEQVKSVAMWQKYMKKMENKNETD